MLNEMEVTYVFPMWIHLLRGNRSEGIAHIPAIFLGGCWTPHTFWVQGNKSHPYLCHGQWMPIILTPCNALQLVRADEKVQSVIKTAFISSASFRPETQGWNVREKFRRGVSSNKLANPTQMTGALSARSISWWTPSQCDLSFPIHHSQPWCDLAVNRCKSFPAGAQTWSDMKKIWRIRGSTF